VDGAVADLKTWLATSTDARISSCALGVARKIQTSPGIGLAIVAALFRVYAEEPSEQLLKQCASLTLALHNLLEGALEPCIMDWLQTSDLHVASACRPLLVLLLLQGVLSLEAFLSTVMLRLLQSDKHRDDLLFSDLASVFRSEAVDAVPRTIMSVPRQIIHAQACVGLLAASLSGLALVDSTLDQLEAKAAVSLPAATLQEAILACTAVQQRLRTRRACGSDASRHVTPATSLDFAAWIQSPLAMWKLVPIRMRLKEAYTTGGAAAFEQSLLDAPPELALELLKGMKAIDQSRLADLLRRLLCEKLVEAQADEEMWSDQLSPVLERATLLIPHLPHCVPQQDDTPPPDAIIAALVSGSQLDRVRFRNIIRLCHIWLSFLSPGPKEGAHVVLFQLATRLLSALPDLRADLVATFAFWASGVWGWLRQKVSDKH
jgi:hypothetical protein